MDTLDSASRFEAASQANPGSARGRKTGLACRGLDDRRTALGVGQRSGHPSLPFSTSVSVQTATIRADVATSFGQVVGRRGVEDGPASRPSSLVGELLSCVRDLPVDHLDGASVINCW